MTQNGPKKDKKIFISQKLSKMDKKLFLRSTIKDNYQQFIFSFSQKLSKINQKFNSTGIAKAGEDRPRLVDGVKMENGELF